MAKILILDGHSPAALAFVRSLGRAGHWVAVGYNRGSFAAAANSRYCRLKWEYKSPSDDAAQFSESVLMFVHKHGIEFVAPMTDATTWPISIYRKSFQGQTHLAITPHKTLELVSDKYRTVTLAQELGIPVPNTELLRSVEDIKNTENWSFPVVVKDRFSIRWTNDKGIHGSVSYAYSKEELLAKVEQRLKVVEDVLVQEFTGGTGIGFSCFISNTDVLMPFQWQRIREKDPRGSGSSARMSVALDPIILKHGSSLLLHSGFQGIAMVEFKKGHNNGDPVLMEINGRPWGSMQLAIHCGVDYPRQLVNRSLGGQLPQRQTRYKTGTTCRWLTADLLHLENLKEGKPKGWPGDYPNFFLNLLKVSMPWYPGLRYDHLSIRDPQPGLADLAMWFKSHFGDRH